VKSWTTLAQDCGRYDCVRPDAAAKVDPRPELKLSSAEA
jgi:hypothetical protein